MDFQSEEKLFITIIIVLVTIIGVMAKRLMDYEKRDNEIIRVHGEDIFDNYNTIFPDLYEKKDFTIKAYGKE